MSQPYQDKFVEVGGTQIHYQDWGNDNAPAILMLHGITSQSHFYDSVAPWLGSQYRCLAVDLPGHGENEHLQQQDYLPEKMANTIVGFIDVLQLKGVHLLGTSLGGAVGMIIASFAPTRLESLAINDIGPDIQPEGVALIGRVFEEAGQSFCRVEDYITKVVLKLLPQLSVFPMNALTAAGVWNLKKSDEGTWNTRFDPAVLNLLNTVVNDPVPPPDTIWRALAEFQKPCLVLRGAESNVLSAATVAKMKETISDLVAVEVKGAGHTPVFVEPDSRQALSNFYNVPEV